MSTSRETLAADVASVRAFNRRYTRHLGLLERGLLGSDLSLTEVRILFELAQHEGSVAATLGASLGVDPGYLSRLLQRLRRAQLISSREDSTDRRTTRLSFSKKGRAIFNALDERASRQIQSWLEPLPPERRAQLVNGTRAIEAALSESSAASTVLLRPPRAGDYGWSVSRHGELYAREYGWNAEFEALVASIVADFIRDLVPERERCWIAELNGERAGSVFLVEKSRRVAQLRLLLVEPSARGHGIGARLVDECSRFAREAGYEKIFLRTNSVLTAARRIYQRAGYRKVGEEPHRSFGKSLVGQNWELSLTGSSSSGENTTGSAGFRRRS